MKRGFRFALLVAVALLALPGSAAAFGPLASFGSFGDGAGELEKPYGVAFGADGAIYVAEFGNNRVSAFAPDGSFMRAFGKSVHPAGGDICIAASGCLEGASSAAAAALIGPKGVAFGPEGNLFVSDWGNNRIAVYAPEGVYIRAFGKGVNAGPGAPDACTSECQAGAGGEEAGEVGGPAGIAFDESGLLYVADADSDRVDVFDTDGEFLRAFGKDVEKGGPGDVCVAVPGCEAGAADGLAGSIADPLDVAVLSGGQLAVADEGNDRVDSFNTDGEFLRAVGREVGPLGADVCTVECQAGEVGAGAGAFANPGAVAAADAGNLYVGDTGNNRVVELGSEGEFVRAFGQGVFDGAAEFQICTAALGCQAGSPGAALGATSLPFGVAVDCRGAVYVAEQEVGISRVERFGEPGTPPPCDEAPSQPPAAISVAPVPAARAPSNRFRFVGLRLNRRNGGAILFVRVSGRGELFLWGRGVRRVRRVVRQAKLVRLPVLPKIPLKRFLKRHGKARIRVKVAFQPVGGVPKTREKRIVLRRKRHS